MKCAGSRICRAGKPGTTAGRMPAATAPNTCTGEEGRGEGARRFTGRAAWTGAWFFGLAVVLRALFILTICIPLNRGWAQNPAELWLAPDGADTNPGTREKPLATLATAQRQARELRRTKNPAAQTGLHIVLRGGTYRLDHPLLLRAEDSGTETSPTLIEAAPGEHAVLSGGVPVSTTGGSCRTECPPIALAQSGRSIVDRRGRQLDASSPGCLTRRGDTFGVRMCRRSMVAFSNSASFGWMAGRRSGRGSRTAPGWIVCWRGIAPTNWPGLQPPLSAGDAIRPVWKW